MNTISMAQVKTLLNTGLTMVLGMTQAALIGGMVQTQDGMRKLIMIGMALQMVQIVLAHRAVPDGYISTAMAAWLRLQDAKANTLSITMNDMNSDITSVTSTGPVSFGQFHLPEQPGVGDMEVHRQGAAVQLPAYRPEPGDTVTLGGVVHNRRATDRSPAAPADT